MDSQLATLNQQQAIQLLAASLLSSEQVKIEPTHTFAPGIYAREITVPAGTVIVGHVHKQPTLNIVLKGRALVAHDGKVEQLVAPFMFVSGAQERKAALVIEDLTWVNVHPTTETDVAKIEEQFIDKSDWPQIEQLNALLQHKGTLCLG